MIEYSRGRIVVLDRPRLEQLSCECYAQVRVETDRLLPRPAASAHREEASRFGGRPQLGVFSPASAIAPMGWKTAAAV